VSVSTCQIASGGASSSMALVTVRMGCLRLR
jgi:hypothetical protein